MKRALGWLLLATVSIGPAWLLATESGLRAAVRIAEAATDGALSVGEIEGRWVGTFELRDLRYRTPAATVQLQRATLNLRLTRLLIGRIQAESLSVQTLAISLRDSEPAQPEPGEPLSLRMPLQLAVENGEVRDFRLQLGDNAKPWRLPEFSFAARWRDQWIRVAYLKAVTAEAGPLQARGELAIADDRLLFADFELRGPGSLQAEGAWALSDEAEHALKLAWKDLRLPGDAQPWFGSPQGELTLQGPGRDFAWSLNAHVHAADIPGELSARGRAAGRSLWLQRSELRTLEGRARAEGRLEILEPRRADLSVSWQAINPGARFKDWVGSLNGSAAFKGEWRTQVPQVEFEGSLHDSVLRGYPLNLQVSGRTEDKQVFLSELALQSGASRLRAQGRLLPDFALQAQLSSSDLRSLWEGLSGRAQLNAGLRGTAQAPRLSLQGGAEALVYGDYRAGQLVLYSQLSPQGYSELDLRLQDLYVGTDWVELRLRGRGTRGRHWLRLEGRGVETSGRLAVEGGERDSTWRGEVIEATLSAPKVLDWTLEEPAALRYGAGRLELDPVCVRSGESRACLQAQLAPQRQRIAFRMQKFDLLYLQPWLPQEWKLSGELTGTASLRLHRGELADLRADLEGSPGAVEAGGARLDFGAGRLSVQPDGERLHARLQLAPGGGELDAELWLAPGAGLLDRPLLGDLRMRFPDLAWLPVLSPEIASAQGALDARLQVSGSLRSPSLDGRMGIENGRMRLATPGIELTEIAAAFERHGDAPISVRLDALSGGGPLELRGELHSLQPWPQGRFTLKGDKAQGFNTPELRAWISPDLQLALTGGTARLTGELRVPRAEITPRKLDPGGIGPSADQVLVRDEEAGAAAGPAIETEVRIVLGEDVRFDGLGLKTRLAGDITAYDDPGRPTRGRGELRLIGGRYKAYGQELQIESGRLLFNGPVTDPAIDVSAYRQPRKDIKVSLRARGLLDAPQFTLSSEPAMSQEEQLSWLVLGRSLSGTLQSGERGQLADAAVSLGLSGGELLAQQLAPRLGFDEVTVGAKPGETADLARFTVGKYLSPKLFVSYGVGLFQPGHLFRLQYDLGRGFKLSGESGVQQGGDLLYTIER